MLRRRPIMRAAVGTAVVAGTATAISGRVARHQENRAAEQAQSAPAQAPPPAQAAPEPPASPPATNPLDELEKLGALHERGIVSDAEFEMQKSRLLAQLGQ